MDSRKRGHKSSRNMQTGYISRSHLFHVSLAFISLEHQLESACKCYTCQAKRLALPAGPLFMDETSPRARRNASRSPECSLSSATRNTIDRSLARPLSGVRPTIFQLVEPARFHWISEPASPRRGTTITGNFARFTSFRKNLAFFGMEFLLANSFGRRKKIHKF